MALDVWFTSDIRARILAGLVLAIETANAQNLGNVEFCSGVLAMAQHQALTFGLSWPAIVKDARQALGGDLGDLLQLEARV